MNTVTLNIKKLGAIKDSEIELKPLMVFSGESGLGKSYAAFLVHYLYMLLLGKRLENFFAEKEYDIPSIYNNKQPGQVLLRLSTQEVFSWINKDAITYIGYMIGHKDFEGEIEINFPYKYEYFEFVFYEEISGLNNSEDVVYRIELNDFRYNIFSNSFKPEATPFYVLIRAELTKAIFGYHMAVNRAYLMPPSRGALMELTERPPFRSGMYHEYFDFKNALNTPLSKPEIISPAITDCLSEVNNGSLKEVEGNMMYYTSDGNSMPLTAAASSIKELAPFTLLLNKFSPKGISVLLEEPEAHLHPEKQVKIADLIACAVNEGCHIQITTHSDYLIKRINNLIKLYQLKDRINPDSFNSLLTKWHIKNEYLIEPDKIGAYLLKRMEDGTSQIIPQDILPLGEIPFESFYQAIDDDIMLSREIRELD